MPDHGRMTGRRHILLFALIAALAVACAALSLCIRTDSWTAWFHHPAQARLELTRQGAVLWRIMLGATAIMLVVMTVWWVRHATMPPDSGIPEIEGSPPRSGLLWLSGIVVVALLVRGTRINESLWYDEIASWMTYTGGVDSAGAIMGSFLDPINHVAHTLLNWISVRLFVSSLG